MISSGTIIYIILAILIAGVALLVVGVAVLAVWMAGIIELIDNLQTE